MSDESEKSEPKFLAFTVGDRILGLEKELAELREGVDTMNELGLPAVSLGRVIDSLTSEISRLALFPAKFPYFQTFNMKKDKE